MLFHEILFSLNRRKEEWSRAEQERIASIPDPEMPPGHRLLPDAERRQTLEKLRQSKLLPRATQVLKCCKLKHLELMPCHMMQGVAFRRSCGRVDTVQNRSIQVARLLLSVCFVWVSVALCGLGLFL